MTISIGINIILCVAAAVLAISAALKFISGFTSQGMELDNLSKTAVFAVAFILAGLGALALTPASFFVPIAVIIIIAIFAGWMSTGENILAEAIMLIAAVTLVAAMRRTSIKGLVIFIIIAAVIVFIMTVYCFYVEGKKGKSEDEGKDYDETDYEEAEAELIAAMNRRRDELGRENQEIARAEQDLQEAIRLAELALEEASAAREGGEQELANFDQTSGEVIALLDAIKNSPLGSQKATLQSLRSQMVNIRRQLGLPVTEERGKKEPRKPIQISTIVGWGLVVIFVVAICIVYPIFIKTFPNLNIANLFN